MQGITSDDILGKDAVDPTGDILGVVMKLHIDKSQKKIIGITVDQGFLKPELFVGINHVQNFGVDAVFLNKVPFAKFKGLKVLSSAGGVVGVVKSVSTRKGKVDFLIVSKGISKDDVKVPSSSVDRIQENVILKKDAKFKNVDQ